MKKTMWMYLSCFCLLFFLFSSVYYFSYRNLELEKELELAKGERGTDFSAGLAENETEAAPAEKQEGLFVNKDMLYIAQSYNESNGLLTETILPVPEEYLGLTRENLIAFLREENQGKSLVSFSSARLVIRNKEEIDPNDYRFLLILEEGYLKIYYSDRSDVYMETYLTEEELPASEVKVLKDGYYIKGTGELYDYLESITS